MYSASGEEGFKFRNYIPMEKCVVLYLNKPEYPSTNDVCAKFGWNWQSVYGVFLLYRNYLLLEMGMTLHLNKLKTPLNKDALCHDLLELVLWIWRRWKCEKFTNFHMCKAFGLGELKKKKC